MEFTLQAGPFKQALTYASLVTTKQSSLDILQGIHITVTPQGGKVRATNLQLGVEISFPATTEHEIVFVCDPTLILGVMTTSAPDHKIVCTLEETTLHITTPSSETTIKLLVGDDFPTLPKTNETKILETKTNDLVQAWQSVVYAASQSDIKPEISSVFMYTTEGDNDLVCVSTDSFRLAEKSTPTMSSTVIEGVMVPVKNIATLTRILGDAGEITSISFSESQMSFSTANIYAVTRLTNGRYPAYQQILPREFSTETTLLKNDLGNALKTLSVFADKFYQIDIVVDSTQGLITLSTHHPERGSHTAKIEAVIEGGDLEIRCNAKYLQDCLGSITSDSCTLKFVAGNKPFIVEPVGSHDFQYLVMPLNR
jgi:DNA polymerase-3 subunit beta